MWAMIITIVFAFKARITFHDSQHWAHWKHVHQVIFVVEAAVDCADDHLSASYWCLLLPPLFNKSFVDYIKYHNTCKLGHIYTHKISFTSKETWHVMIIQFFLMRKKVLLTLHTWSNIVPYYYATVETKMTIIVSLR